jgi:hypothetical protein
VQVLAATAAGAIMPTYRAVSVAAATAVSRARILRAVFMPPLDQGQGDDPSPH